LDGTTRRLKDLARDMQQSLGSAATVVTDDSDPWAAADFRPTRPEALGISWVELGDEVVLSTARGLGGRWELGRSPEDMDFLQDVVSSVVAGRVVEVRAGDRSRIEVTLADGSVAVEIGGVGLRSLLPKPGWQRWGRRIEYAPYLG
jgi:hypothetical protein